MTGTQRGDIANGGQAINILISGNVQTGDKVSVSIPTYGKHYTDPCILDLTVPQISASDGSTDDRMVGNNRVISFTFSKSGKINALIIINKETGYYARVSPMPIAKPTETQITWAVNGHGQKAVDFLINIDPVCDPRIRRVAPDESSSDPNVLKKIFPGYRTVYNFKVNESNGLAPGQDYKNIPYPSSVVNSAVNYGTTITIPMPAGFVLDREATKSANNFGNDGTSIAQSGNDIIITVPKGGGHQNWTDGNGAGYQIIGAYNIPLPDHATTIKANGPITIKQKRDDSNDPQSIKIWTTPLVVTEDVYGKDEKIPLGTCPLYTATAFQNSYLLNNGKKQVVAYFGATNKSIASFDNYQSTFTLTFDQKLGVTEIKTPTMTGTKSYRYTIRYSDGTTTIGQVDAGQVIHGNGIITQIKISPDSFKQDQGTAQSMPANNFGEYADNGTQDTSTNAFLAYGVITNTGSPLKANFSFEGKIADKLTLAENFKEPLKQMVISPADLTSSTGLYKDQTKSTAGQTNVGYMGLYATYNGSFSNNIFEPIFYYVIPEGFTVSDFSTDYDKMFTDLQGHHTVNTNNGVIGVPEISLFTVSTGKQGISRQVVKIDYSGTGYNFKVKGNVNDTVRINSLSDTMKGSYDGMIYVVSPKTKLTNPAYNADNISSFAPTGIKFDPSWVQDNTNYLYYVGSYSFNIDQSGKPRAASNARGNKDDDMFMGSATADVYGLNKLQYAVSFINETSNDLKGATALINLPQASDNNSFTFLLNGKPDFDNKNEGYTFFYSTEPGTLLHASDEAGAKPVDKNFVSADKVADWAKIKSIMIKLGTLGAGKSTDRIIITGYDPNLLNDAGKVGYLSTGFYSDSTKPSINSNDPSNKDPNKIVPANIKITGAAKINYKLHYTDAKGVGHTVDLPSKTYDLTSDKVPTAQEVLQKVIQTAKDQALNPDGYEINSDPKSITIQADQQYQGHQKDMVFSQQGEQQLPVKYYYNNATVTVEAVPMQGSVTYQFVDGKDIVGEKKVSGAVNSVQNTELTLPSNYALAEKQEPLPTSVKIGKGNLNVVIQVKHDTQDVSETKTVMRSITYVDPTTNTQKTMQVQTVTLTHRGILDKVTKQTKWGNWPTGSFAKFTGIPSFDDYTASPSELDEEPVNVNSQDTMVTITYTKMDHTNTIRYVDQNGKAVKTDTVTGKNGDPIQITIPNGYHFDHGKVPILVINSKKPVQTVKVIADKTNTGEPITHDEDVLNIIRYVDENGNVIKTDTATGKDGDPIALTLPAGYQLVAGQLPSLTIDGRDLVRTIEVVRVQHNHDISHDVPVHTDQKRNSNSARFDQMSNGQVKKADAGTTTAEVSSQNHGGLP